MLWRGNGSVGRVRLAAYHAAMILRKVPGLQTPPPMAVSRFARSGLSLLVGLAIVSFAVPESVQGSAEARSETSPPSTIANEDRSRQEFPRRIITIAPNSAEIICALGACDSIVGVSKFCVYPPKLRDRPRVGGLFDPDIEKIIALRPDLIVLRGRSETVERLAADQGITLYFDRTEKLGDVVQTLRELGERLGCGKEAERLVEKFLARIQRVRKRVEEESRPRVLLTVSRQPDRLANLMTTGRGTFLDEMIEIAGGVNVFGRLDMAYPQISPEGIVAHRPDVIIELMPEVELDAKLERQLSGQWKALDSVPAVRSLRIHFITDDNALIPSPRYVEIIEKVSRILHPESDDGG